MMRQLRIVNIIFYFITLVIILWHPGLCQAGPYYPENTVQIQSESSGSDEPGDSRNMKWHVTPRKNNDGSTSLMFFMEKADQPITQIRINPSGNSVQWEGDKKGPDIMLRDGLLIAPGYPVPCDILPVSLLLSGKKEPLTYDVKRTAGGVTFADQIRVDITPVKMEEALKNRWISKDFQKSDSMWMIRAVNLRTNAMLVRQLWSSTSSWWIYEETPYRRSWQVR
jgi:hypothetical protein